MVGSSFRAAAGWGGRNRFGIVPQAVCLRLGQGGCQWSASAGYPFRNTEALRANGFSRDTPSTLSNVRWIVGTEQRCFSRCTAVLAGGAGACFSGQGAATRLQSRKACPGIAEPLTGGSQWLSAGGISLPRHGRRCAPTVSPGMSRRRYLTFIESSKRNSGVFLIVLLPLQAAPDYRHPAILCWFRRLAAGGTSPVRRSPTVHRVRRRRCIRRSCG